MTRVEAYHILTEMWKDANEKQREAIDIAQNDIEFVDLTNSYSIKTNADHIRSMSDEELAEMVGMRTLCSYIQDNFYELCETTSVCRGCVERWLKQLYKEDTDG